MQFRVPQNIAMEDRIIGNLNPIQFTILSVGGGVSLLIFQSAVIPKPFSTMLGALFGIMTVLLSLGKFNDQPMYRFIRYIIQFIMTPKIRIWRKKGMQPVLIKPAPPEKKKEERKMHKNVSKADITNLALILDSRGKEGISAPQQSDKSP